MEPGKGDRITLVGLTIILVIHFVGLLGPTDEMPSSTLSTITILLEVGMVSALVALGFRVLRSLPPDALRGGWIFLLVVGAGAGLGIFGIRLSGGQRLELPPRRTSVTDLPSVPTANTTPDTRIRDMFALAQHPPGSEAQALPKQLHDLIAESEKLNQKAVTGPWVAAMKKDPTLHAISREDLRGARAAYVAVHECNERILKVFAEAEAKGVDLSGASETKILTRAELWRATQNVGEAFDAKLALIDQYWDEWSTPFPAAERDLKPWQREMNRVDEKLAASSKELAALVKAPPTSLAATTPSPPAVSAHSDMDELMLKTRLLPAVADYVQARQRLQQTRWIKIPDVSIYQPHKITSADLHEAREKMGGLLTTIDKVIADLNRSSVPVPASETEYWRAKRETYVLFQELTKLLEDHWKEWHVSGIQRGIVDAKPWQTEAIRLNTAIVTLSDNKLTSILL